jgi:surface antigen
MSKQQRATRTVTVVPAANILAKRFVTMAWAQAGANAGAATTPLLGVADENITAGLPGRVIRGETAIVEAGAAIDGEEGRLQTDSVGRVIEWASGQNVVGYLVPGQTATAAGQFVEIYLVQF